MKLSDNISKKLDQASKIVDLDLDWELIRPYEKEKWTEFPDLSAFTRLEKLSLSGHQLSGFPSTPQVPTLRSLDLSYNTLEHTQGISHWPNLDYLDLSFNELQRIEGLEAFGQLSSLFLSHNYLEDIHVIGNLNQLQKLSISGNRRIKDISSLASLPNLEVLFAKQLFILDWTALTEIRTLRAVYLSPVNASSIQVLGTLPHLEKLHLSAGKMGHKIDLPAMAQLQELTIHKGKDLELVVGWEKCPQVTVLNLAQNQLGILPSIGSLKELREITLKQNPLRQIDELFSLNKLEKIDLRDTHVSMELIQRLRKDLPDAEILR